MESLTIRDEDQNLISMRFSESQELIWSYVAPRLDNDDKLWFIVLKGRQVYATTFFQNLVFVRSLARPNTNSLVIAQDLYSAADIFGMAKRFYDHLPLPKLKPSKVKEIEFPFAGGSSRLKVVSAGNIAKGRGTTQSCVHASEVAYWPQPEVLVGLFQAVPDLPDTIWVLESTANGMVGLGQTFYEEWKAAVDGRSNLTPIFIPWYLMRKYRQDPPLLETDWSDEEKILVENFREWGLDGSSLRWRRFVIDTKLHGSTQLFAQEFPCTPTEAFISTGLPAFEGLAILKQEKNLREPGRVGLMENSKFLRTKNGWLRIWKDPEDGHQYVIGVDTATGVKGGDYACAQVLDMGTLEQVAILHGFIDPWNMGHQLAQVGTWYNKAVLAVEVQGTGWAVQDYLMRVFNYPHLHIWRGRPDQIRPIPGHLYGWVTNVHSRPLLIEAGRRAINTALITVRDRSTLDEIQKFSRSDTGKYEAEIGHDDRVMALLIALRSREENYEGAKKYIINPEYDYSLSELPGGIKVIRGPDDPEFLMRRQVHLDLRKNARKAGKHWMSL